MLKFKNTKKTKVVSKKQTKLKIYKKIFIALKDRSFNKISKEFPKSSKFYNKVIKNINLKEGPFFMWFPGMLYISPFLVYIKLKKTERVLSDLEKMGVSLDSVLSNKDVIDSINRKSVYLRPKSKLLDYKHYLNTIKNKVNGK